MKLIISRLVISHKYAVSLIFHAALSAAVSSVLAPLSLCLSVAPQLSPPAPAADRPQAVRSSISNPTSRTFPGPTMATYEYCGLRRLIATLVVEIAASRGDFFLISAQNCSFITHKVDGTMSHMHNNFLARAEQWMQTRDGTRCESANLGEIYLHDGVARAFIRVRETADVARLSTWTYAYVSLRTRGGREVQVRGTYACIRSTEQSELQHASTTYASGPPTGEKQEQHFCNCLVLAAGRQHATDRCERRAW